MFVNRRDVLSGFGGASMLLCAPKVLGQVRSDTITVLYRAATPSAPNRLDPAVQAALLALEEEFLARGLRVLQPKPDVYAVLDKGPSVVVTFADDAGFCAMVSAYRNLRPQPGQEMGIAEVRLQVRVFVGRHTLAALEGRGQMATRIDAASREFGERRATELASRRAAADVAEKIATKLKDLSPAQIQELIRRAPSPSMQVAEVSLPELSAPSTPPSAGGFQSAPAPGQSAVEAAAPVGQRYALLVGVSDYPSLKGPAREQSALPGVAKDMENMKATLLHLGWDAKRIVSLVEEQATGANVRGVLKVFQRHVQKDDLILVFVSGHGAPKNHSLSGYGRPILADDTGAEDPSTMDFWELQSLVRNLACDRSVFVIDTCHAGGAATKLESVTVGASAVTAGPALAGPSGASMAKLGDQAKHLAIVTASRADEVSGDLPTGGLFTLTFLSALRAAKSSEPLGRVIAQRVAPAVIEQSRETCRRRGPQCRFPQQTPEIHFTGQGSQIVI